MAVIGISCFYHDSAVSLVSDEGEILAAVQEERFSRKKNDSSFPISALNYCYQVAQKNNHKITAYVYYEKPIRLFMRLLETYFGTAPRGFSSFRPAMQSWINKKIFIKEKISEEISRIDSDFSEENLFFSEHHLSHAAAAFYPSPFDKSAILCMDAVGEWATTSAWFGENNLINPIWEIDFPDSIGMLYSSFTYYCGFKVNSGEYKLMGLAPYGEPIYIDLIKNNLIDIKPDGSFKLNMGYFKYHRGLRMISTKFINLFNNPPRSPNENISKFYMDVAASIQKVTEEIVIKLSKNLQEETGLENLCLAGGVALNCVANGKILEESGFKNIWIQPASGDAGSSIGCALSYLYSCKNIKRYNLNSDCMSNSYLGPEYNDNEIEQFLKDYNISYEKVDDKKLIKDVSNYLIDGLVIGWFQGRMEFGPRALGNRSILGDPRKKDMQKIMNIKIKNRESFRPFAPAILDEHKKDYFDLDIESPYMLLTRNLNRKYLIEEEKNNFKTGLDRVNEVRSVLPAITHVDNSCRVQTVSYRSNKKFHKLINDFFDKSGHPVLINTSFNVRGEPIVCTPEDALRCFIYTNIDVLVLGSIVIKKKNINDDIKAKFYKPILTED